MTDWKAWQLLWRRENPISQTTEVLTSSLQYVCLKAGNALPAFSQSDIRKKIVEVQVFFLKNKNKKRKMYVCAVFQRFEVKGVGCLFFSWAFVLDCLRFYAFVNHDSKWTGSITTILWWSAALLMQTLSPFLLWTQSHQRFLLLSLELVRIQFWVLCLLPYILPILLIQLHPLPS